MNDEERVLFPTSLHAVGKINYVKGEKRPKVKCILCSVKNNDKRVKALKIYEEELLYISLNLYPYNPGHLMVIPSRHVESFNELTGRERNRIFKVSLNCQKMLRKLYSPTGFNVGYNEGKFSGASIKHIHVHIVPRYKGELGYIDIIGGTRIVVTNSDAVFTQIKNVIHKYVK